MKECQKGDKHFLFGFAREVKIARSLAGLVSLGGIPNSERGNLQVSINEARKVYSITDKKERKLAAIEHWQRFSHTANIRSLNEVISLGLGFCRCS